MWSVSGRGCQVIEPCILQNLGGYDVVDPSEAAPDGLTLSCPQAIACDGHYGIGAGACPSGASVLHGMPGPWALLVRGIRRFSRVAITPFVE